MKNISGNFFENKNIFKNHLLRRVSVLLIITMLVLTISHVYNIKNLEAQAQALHEKETRSKEIYVDGEFIGEVRNEENFDEIVFEIKENLQFKEGMDVKILNDIDIVDAHAEDEELSGRISLINKLRGKLQYDVVAYGVEVDGEIIGELP